MSSDVEKAAEKIAAGKKARADRELARCYRACFMDEHGRLTLEGEKVLADLRELAELFGTAIKRDGQGQVDLLLLLRMESRREIVLRVVNVLGLDPREIGQFTEVDKHA